MFKAHFIAVAEFLGDHGIHCLVKSGRVLSDIELANIEATIHTPIPAGLLQYWREMGDGFSLQWQLPGSSDCDGLVNFSIGFAEDIIAEHPWMQEQNIGLLISENEAIRAEASNRLKWVPFYGVGEGGIVLCLDVSTEAGAVRYYESYWSDYPKFWNSFVAESLESFVRNWSRYCFSPPLKSTVIGRPETSDGKSDWSPANFDPKFDRGAC